MARLTHSWSRRGMLASGGASMLISSSPSAWAAPDDRTPLRCADFLDTIGVNTHLGYGQSEYADTGITDDDIPF